MALFRARPLAAGCLVFILLVPPAFALDGLLLFLVPIIALCLSVGCFFLRRRAPYVALCLFLVFFAVALAFGRVALDRALYRALDGALGGARELTLRVEDVTYRRN